MRTCFEYLKLLIFAAGVLFGLQVPGFVEQYGSRLEARMLESNQSLKAFQADADKYFNGNIERLIIHYNSNPDQVIKDGGHSLEAVYLRNQTLSSAYKHFSSNSVAPYIHTLLQPLDDVRENTLKRYNFVVLLNTSSIIWALASGLLLTALSNLLFGFLRVLAIPFRRRPIKQKRPQSIEPDMGL